MELVGKAILAGFGISIMIGPIFFGLIQLSVEKGAKAGITYSTGIWLSDLLFVFLVQKGLGYIGTDPRFILGFGIVGSLILIGFGIAIYISPIKKPDHSEFSVSNGIGYFLKGVSINLFNPFVILLWISILSIIREETIVHQWIFVGTLLSVVALTDILKSFFAAKILSRLENAKLELLKTASAFILAGFGIALLVRTILNIT